MPAYNWDQYRSDLLTALLTALGITVLAAIPLGIMGLVNLVDIVRGHAPEIPWLTYAALWLVLIGSYFAAAATAGSAVFVLRPLRTSVIGWLLTGAIVTLFIYVTVGVGLAVFYHPVGALVFEDSSPQEAWSLIPGLALYTAPVGAVAGFYAWWRDRRGKPLT